MVINVKMAHDNGPTSMDLHAHPRDRNRMVQTKKTRIGDRVPGRKRAGVGVGDFGLISMQRDLREKQR